MDLEQIVQQILVTRRDLTREEVLKLIYNKKRSAEDYLLDDVAARIIAAELGVELPQTEEAFKPEISVSSLVTGLNDVTVTARVIAVYPVQTFSKQDLTQGKVARLLLADETGSLRLVLWNDKISLVETGKIKQGDIVRVLHGYVREGLDGKLELQVGQKGDVQVSEDAVQADYPTVDEFVDKIGQLTQSSKNANVAGVVSDVYPASEFKRKDGSTGKVRRLRLQDETGDIAVVFWNEKTGEVGEVQRGDRLRIMNARVKAQPDSRIELHVENAVQVQIERRVGQGLPQPDVQSAMEVTRKIAELKEGRLFTVEAVVATVPNIREVRVQNEKVLVASFDLSDATGKIRVSLWREQAELGKELAVGTRIRIKNVYVKKGFSNLLELTSRTATTLKILSKSEVEAPRTE